MDIMENINQEQIDFLGAIDDEKIEIFTFSNIEKTGESSILILIFYQAVLLFVMFYQRSLNLAARACKPCSIGGMR